MYFIGLYVFIHALTFQHRGTQHNQHTHNTFKFQTLSNRAYLKLLRLIGVSICLSFISRSKVHGYAGNGKITFHPNWVKSNLFVYIIVVHALSGDGSRRVYDLQWPDFLYYYSGNLIPISYFDASSVLKVSEILFLSENSQVKMCSVNDSGY